MRPGVPVLPAVQPPNILDPQGPTSEPVVVLWWVMLVIATVVFVAMLVLLAVSLVRRRHGEVDDDRIAGEGLAGGGNLITVLGGVVVPGVIVVGLMAATVTTTADIATVRGGGGGGGGGDDALTIEVTGHQFWFDVAYPDADVRLANEAHIPAGRPVEFKLSSADVIHTFWAPQLAGKADMIPGEETSMRVQADEPGEYRGFCTEYCGIQHARMQFVVVVHEPADFQEWLEERQVQPQPPEEESALAGREVFFDAGCAECHTIEGVNPGHTDFPDLTHLADRRTIGAGTLENNRGNLAGWILDPQQHKPGNRMPPSNLGSEELNNLLDYLETLE